MLSIGFLLKETKQHPFAFVNHNDFNANTMNHLIDNPKLKGALFGIEKMITKKESNVVVFVPPRAVLDSEKVKNPNEIPIDAYSHVFSIELEKNSLFPLNFTPYKHVFSELSSLDFYLEEDQFILIQLLLLNRNDNLRNEFISQYTDYLNGVDNPLPYKFFRIIQRKIVLAMDKWVDQDSVREPVEEIERKILEDVFQFEFRIILNSANEPSLFVEKINELLVPHASFNALCLKATDARKMVPFIQNRMFSSIIYHELVSKSELLSLFSQDFNQIVPEIETAKEEVDLEPENSEKVELMAILPEGKVQTSDSNGKRYVSMFANTFKSLKLLHAQESLKIDSVEDGATLRKLTFFLPNGIKLSDVKGNLDNIQAQTGIDYIDISKGAKPGTVSFMFPKEKRSIVYLRDLLQNDEFKRFMKKSILPFSIGTDEIGNPIYIDLAKVYHLLIAGSTGSGKSVFLVQLLLSLIIVRKPSELQLYMIDPKRVELKKFKEFPHVKELVYDADEAVVILNSLVHEMERRYELLDEYDVDELNEYNKKRPKEKLPYIVCVIDEFADLIMLNDDVKTSIVRLGQKARACGIHLICATQRPEAKIVDGLIKANLPTKISFRCSSIHDYKTVFGNAQPYHLLGNGDGSIKLEGASREFIRFQGPVIHEDKSVAQACLKKLSMKINDDGMEGIELLDTIQPSVPEIEPIDKLKSIIAKTGETRISQLQKHMKMRINTVQDLMTVLVKEGWLIKHKAKSKGYELIASEEELQQWRNKNSENDVSDENS